MGELLKQLGGPYFDFLIVEKDKLWERRGRVKRVVGIKSEYFHHPQALRLPDCVISIFVEALRLSHEKFSYHGYTIYEAAQLNNLIAQLQLQLERINSCQNKTVFDALLTERFISYCDDHLGKWQSKWELLKGELIECIGQIIDKAQSAQNKSKELLVLGV